MLIIKISSIQKLLIFIIKATGKIDPLKNYYFYVYQYGSLLRKVL